MLDQSPLLRLVLWLFLLPLARCGPVHSQSPALSLCRSSDDTLALIIDVDNTLYNEERIKRLGGRGIEEQIIANTHAFCARHFQLTPKQADDLYHAHGSSIEGLRQEHSANTVEVMEQFYHEVYDPIDMSSLLLATRSHMDTTGYSHSGDDSSQLLEFLKNVSFPMYLASNSPSWHVRKVLAALGLSTVPWAGMLTPDLCSSQTADMPFPTKAHPEVFYKELLVSHSNTVMLDDSQHNVDRAKECGMNAIHVSKNCTLQEALAIAVGHVSSDYSFSDVDYLKSKNVVDAQAVDATTWEQVARHLQVPDNGILTVFDVGAGLLSMLQLLLQGHGDKRPLIDMMRKGSVKGIEYYAYEPNTALSQGCREHLTKLGFQLREESESEVVFYRKKHNVTVHLRFIDFCEDSRVEEDPSPQLIVGCCFADLMQPRLLVQSLLRFLSCRVPSNEDALIYFPITFSGITQFLPPQPFVRRDRRSIPSDTAAFGMYADALTNQHGHNLDPDRIVSAMNEYGVKLLHRGPSDWNIDSKQNEYLWNTMLYFFGTVGAPEMMKQGWDSVGWINRVKENQPSIRVSNVDLLFKLPSDPSPASCVDEQSAEESDSTLSIQEIQFTAPYQAGTSVKTVDTANLANLGPNQVEVRSECSLISSGTELKIYKGLFDDAALDVNIDGMADERMAYPLAYGYSLVGRVTRCGNDVDKDLLGRLVFTFSPHSSHVIVDQNALQVVPDDIDAEDAIFMPSVETALSMVHDAHVRVGERVAVFGQGLIGLLVTAILSTNAISGTITTLDAIPERLAASAAMGSSEALLPSEATLAGPFDVSVEVSGSARALQSAIDNTRSGGRIIVGSWYGNADVTLKLGIDFHRSHKTIKTSQVSEIPAELSALWSKERRFALTWELVKQIRPSRLITRRTTLEHAKEAYDALDQGNELAVSFSYPTN